jgi:hypothetical protein
MGHSDGLICPIGGPPKNMRFSDWEDELESEVRARMGADLSEVGYDARLARRAWRDGASPRSFMESDLADPDAAGDRGFDDAERELGLDVRGW